MLEVMSVYESKRQYKPLECSVQTPVLSYDSGISIFPFLLSERSDYFIPCLLIMTWK